MNADIEKTWIENIPLRIQEHEEKIAMILAEREAMRNLNFHLHEQVIIFGKSRPETMQDDVLQALAWHEIQLVNKGLQ